MTKSANTDNTATDPSDDDGVCTMTLLNQTGDVTITWTKGEDAAIREFVEKKLKEGHSFFIMDRPPFLKRLFGAKPTQIAVRSVDELPENRSLVLADSDAQALFDSQKVSVVSTPVGRSAQSSGKPAVMRRARNTDEVAKSRHTAMLKPIVGG